LFPPFGGWPVPFFKSLLVKSEGYQSRKPSGSIADISLNVFLSTPFVCAQAL
jgi:hypothetical protein